MSYAKRHFEMAMQMVTRRVDEPRACQLMAQIGSNFSGRHYRTREMMRRVWYAR